MRNRFVVLIMVVIVLMGGVGVVQSAYRDSVRGSQTDTEIINESFTAQQGQVTTLANSNRAVVYDDNVTVYNNTGVLVPRDGNWTWFVGNGTIKTNSSSFIDDGESATVTYHYYEPAPEQTAVKDLALLPLMTLGDDLVFILGLGVLVAAGVVLIRMGGR